MPDLSAQPSDPQTSVRDELAADVEALLAKPEGRRVLMWILGQCGVYGAIYAGEEAPTNFNLGRREIGLRIINLLNTVSPTAYPHLLLKRAQDDEVKKGEVHVLDAEE